MKKLAVGLATVIALSVTACGKTDPAESAECKNFQNTIALLLASGASHDTLLGTFFRYQPEGCPWPWEV